MAKYLVALDDGHSPKTPGKETPPIPELNNRIIKENGFNKAVVSCLDVELKRCGIDTILVAPTDEDTSLSARVKAANDAKADIYVSIHYNALDGKFDSKDPSGHSIHIYPGSERSRRLAECVHKYLIQGTNQIDRGIIESDFHVIRETKMPAILSENGFMDNKREALLMLDKNFQKEVATEHAKGICDYLGVKYVPEVRTVYRLMVGEFGNLREANAARTRLKSLGYESTVMTDKI